METKNSLREYLFSLFSAAGIRSANSDADKLAEKFPNLLYILHLDTYNLTSISGCSDSAAELVRLTAALTSRRITDRFKFGRKYTESEIRDFAVGKLFGLDSESVYALLFDKNEKFISCEHICDGSVNTAVLIPRKIIDLAKRQGTPSVVVIHNHPRGIPEPSVDDIRSTASVNHVLSYAGIECKHNYVVSGFDVFDTVNLIEESKPDADESTYLRVSSPVGEKNKNERYKKCRF